MRIRPVVKITKIVKNFLQNPVAYGASCMAFLGLLIQERRLGIKTSGFSLPEADPLCVFCKDASVYAATSYPRLKTMMDYLRLGMDDVFVDLGCGAGRVLFFVGTQRLKKIIGVEIRKDLADRAKRNQENLNISKTPIEIIHGDVSDFNFHEGTVFFMFNPFGEKTLRKILGHMEQCLTVNPRRIRLVYYCAAYADLLNSQGWLIPEGEIGKTDIFMWRNKI
jgi:SAM-dependent methyltransferase